MIRNTLKQQTVRHLWSSLRISPDQIQPIFRKPIQTQLVSTHSIHKIVCDRRTESTTNSRILEAPFCWTMLSPTRTARTLEYRKIKHNLVSTVFVIVLALCALVGCYQFVAHRFFSVEDTLLSSHSRRLLSSCDDSEVYEIPDATYPADAFTEVCSHSEINRNRESAFISMNSMQFVYGHCTFSTFHEFIYYNNNITRYSLDHVLCE